MTQQNKDLADRFRDTTNKLVALIETFDKEAFNRKPAEDKWSAAEVAEHLLLFDSRLNSILASATHSSNRDMSEKVPVFTARISDRTNKIEAPPFLIPSADVRSPEDLIEKIRAERNKICKTIEEIDLTLHSKEFPHRFFGELTAYEWVNLVDVHAKRHIEQLQELLTVKK
ncbi:MAG: DinB family protein [Sediminibacterium sp.]